MITISSVRFSDSSRQVVNPLKLKAPFSLSDFRADEPKTPENFPLSKSNIKIGFSETSQRRINLYYKTASDSIALEQSYESLNKLAKFLGVEITVDITQKWFGQTARVVFTKCDNPKEFANYLFDLTDAVFNRANQLLALSECTREALQDFNKKQQQQKKG